MSDADIDRLRRGGHDPVKIYAAYAAAAAHKGQPTVILAQTKKGYGMGSWGQGKMTTHQQKKLDDEALMAFRDRFALPLTDAQVESLALLQAGRRYAGDEVPAGPAHARSAATCRRGRASRRSCPRRRSRHSPRASRARTIASSRPPWSSSR